MAGNIPIQAAVNYAVKASDAQRAGSGIAAQAGVTVNFGKKKAGVDATTIKGLSGVASFGTKGVQASASYFGTLDANNNKRTDILSAGVHVTSPASPEETGKTVGLHADYTTIQDRGRFKPNTITVGGEVNRHPNGGISESLHANASGSLFTSKNNRTTVNYRVGSQVTFNDPNTPEIKPGKKRPTFAGNGEINGTYSLKDNMSVGVYAGGTVGTSGVSPTGGATFIANF